MVPATAEPEIEGFRHGLRSDAVTVMYGLRLQKWEVRL